MIKYETPKMRIVPNKNRLIRRLKAIHRKNGSPEPKHLHADGALLSFINDPEITEAFEQIDKYYV